MNLVHTHEIKVGTKNVEYYLWHLTDSQIGNKNTREDILGSIVQEIKNQENSLVILGGDKIDAIERTDKRFRGRELASWITIDMLDEISKHQVDRFVKIHNPIKDKIIGSYDGNHEDTVYKYYHHPVGYCIANDLGVNYFGGPDQWINLKFVRGTKEKRYSSTSFNIFMTHGYGGGKTQGAQQNKLENLIRRVPAADIVLMGHNHNRLYCEVFDEYPGTKYISYKKRVGIMGGTMLPSSDFSRRYGFPPVVPGISCIVLRPFSEDVLKQIEVRI